MFVHGVNVRRDAEGRYARAEERRDAFFKEFVLARIAARPDQLVVRNPYWGGHGATFAWDHGALPEPEYETFGAEAGLDTSEILPGVSLAGLLAGGEAPTADRVLPWLAHRGLEGAIDFLMVVATDQRITLNDAKVVARLARAAGAYAFAHRDAPPIWLRETATNELFIDRLAREIETWHRSVVPAVGAVTWESFGLLDTAWEAVRNAADRAKRAVVKLGRRGFRALVRDPLHDTIARFVGDVLVYLERRGTRAAPGPIVQAILIDLQAADAARRAVKEPLVVVAHSMGGNIVYDVLTHFRPELTVDYLVTVGSQVALFEELKLFRASDRSIPNGAKRVPKPVNVRHWLNIFDHSDVLGFATGKVFAETRDFEYETGAWLLGAHGAYFTKPSFHHRLAVRVAEGTHEPRLA